MALPKGAVFQEGCWNGNGFAVVVAVVVVAVNGGFAGAAKGVFATGATCGANGFVGGANGFVGTAAFLLMVLAPALAYACFANGFGWDPGAWGFGPGVVALLAKACGGGDDHCCGFDDGHFGGDWKLLAPHVTLLLCC